VLIEGNPTSSSCALFELAGLKFYGCCNPAIQNSTYTQVITIQDPNGCEFTPPADITIECNESTAPSNTGELNYGCENAVPYTDVVTGTCPEIITRTWELETTTQDQHSCIAGQGGSTAAACFGVGGLTSFQNNSELAIRFEVTLDPSTTGKLTGLSFQEWAPDYFNHLSGNSGINNPPQKYGIRVLKNGVEVFKQIDINTSDVWSLESFDFSNNPMVSVMLSIVHLIILIYLFQ